MVGGGGAAYRGSSAIDLYLLIKVKAVERLSPSRLFCFYGQARAVK
jgi:hypothetical protein